jgi:hypothetical protein
MIALANRGKPIIGYERGEGKYYVALKHLETISQDMVDLDADAMQLTF